MRDLALIGLFLRTGIRRSEATGLVITSLGQAQGHRILTVRGKGKVLRTVKVPTDLDADIASWLEAAHTAGYRPGQEDPLFVSVHKSGHLPDGRQLSGRAIHAIVVRRLTAAGCPPLGPHALRATFATLALKGGAPLYRIQRALGHADPRTTELYLRKADSLDDNAVDYVRLG